MNKQQQCCVCRSKKASTKAKTKAKSKANSSTKSSRKSSTTKKKTSTKKAWAQTRDTRHCTMRRHHDTLLENGEQPPEMLNWSVFFVQRWKFLVSLCFNPFPTLPMTHHNLIHHQHTNHAKILFQDVSIFWSCCSRLNFSALLVVIITVSLITPCPVKITVSFVDVLEVKAKIAHFEIVWRCH